jgi:hypothetical protein
MKEGRKFEKLKSRKGGGNGWKVGSIPGIE